MNDFTKYSLEWYWTIQNKILKSKCTEPKS